MKIIIVYLICCFMQGNVGLPMLIVILPVGLFAFVPVWILESLVMKKYGMGFVRSLKLSFVGNCISTIIGIPVTWVIMVLLQMIMPGFGKVESLYSFHYAYRVMFNSAWLMPMEKEYGWMIPAAGVVLCLPFFVVSFYIERLVTMKMFKSEVDIGVTSTNLKDSVFFGNVISYISIVVALLLLALNYAVVQNSNC